MSELVCWIDFEIKFVVAMIIMNEVYSYRFHSRTFSISEIHFWNKIVHGLERVGIAQESLLPYLHQNLLWSDFSFIFKEITYVN